MVGKVIKEYNHVHPPSFILEKGDLSDGVYFVQVYDYKNLIGLLKFNVISIE